MNKYKQVYSGVSKWVAGFVLAFAAISGTSAQAQTAGHKCGIDLVNEQLKATNPDFDAQIAASQLQARQRTDAYQAAATNMRGTKAPYEIKVVFHIVVDSAQFRQMGSAAGIQARVITQMNQLNTDWNAHNADSVKIPAAFKPLYGNMNVHFSLATKTPTGVSTPGYEIVITNKNSFDAQTGTIGSTYGFSDVKYSSTGGASAWDPTDYYNVWITNMTPAGILGLSTPPRRPPYDAFPVAEQGTVILYGAFGRRTSSSQYFTYTQAQGGRTLTHETGHFFNLFHTWGSTDDCTDDDNISDTPPQAKATPNNSPAYPVLDACSGTAPGIMFMNFMDYAVDSAQSLFTKGQVAMSAADLEPGGLRHSLVQTPTGIGNQPQAVEAFRIYPNPVQQQCVVEVASKLATRAVVMDVTGRAVQQVSLINGQQTLDLSAVAPGLYYIQGFNRAGQLIASGKIIRQ